MTRDTAFALCVLVIGIAALCTSSFTRTCAADNIGGVPETHAPPGVVLP